ncbi:MAG: aminopeptidase P family protein [Anaerolineae bacterium]|nr:aminopeptidase P family protein [Anaerolineae bacterium]
MLFNRDRAIDYMRRCGLDALIATSPVNITYFTDYRLWTDSLMKDYMMSPGASSNLAQNYAVFPLDGEPALVVSPLAAVNAAESWVRDIYVYGDPGFDDSQPVAPLPADLQRFYDVFHSAKHTATSTNAVLSILRTRGLSSARIGIEMEGLTQPARSAIFNALPGAVLKDCSNLIRILRAVKTEDALMRLTYAAEISEQAAMESLALARPGCSAQDMVNHYHAYVAEKGAILDHFSYGVRGLGFATETDYVLSSDDLLEVDFGCIYKGCFSDSGTTLAMQALSDSMQARHAALFACLNAGSAAIAPGVKSSQVRNAMWETLNAHGITASFPHGHGLGMEVRDYPILVADNGLRIRDDCIDLPSDLPLEANMVVNLEAAIRMPTVGSLHMERSFVVTAHGQRPLVPQDRSRPVIPAGASA